MRKQYRSYLFPFFSLAALFIGMLGIRFVFAQGHTQAVSPQKAAPLTCGTWSVVKSPNVGSRINSLSGVAAVSASNIWAVGYYLTSTPVERTLIEHWNGTSWSVVKSPNVGSLGNGLSGVAAVSASNIWAGGHHQNSTPVERTLI